MILAAAEWIYSKLSADSALTTALTGGGGVVLIYPNDFETLPVLTYAVSQQASMMDFWDNFPNANDLTVVLDVYARNDQNTTPIMSSVDSVMTGLFFTLEFCEPLGDAEAKTQHLSMRYARNGVLQSDLI